MSETVDVQLHGHVAWVTFGNPPLNFATVSLLRLLAETLESLDQQPEVRVVVLAASDKVFCAGADLVSENGFGASTDDPLREFYDQVIRLFSTRKPIVAVLQGAAIGAGLGLAVSADFRVASAKARFSANFVKLGFHPGFGLTHTLPRLIGEQRAALMCLTGERYKADTVANWGLVDLLVEDENLNEQALLFANNIAVNAPLSLLTTRATLRGDIAAKVTETLLHEHQQQIQLQGTEDFAEGIRAVAERRSGNFKGC